MAPPIRAALRPVFDRCYRLDVDGLDHVPRSGPVILAANHRSFFDTPALMVVAPRPVVFLGKAEYMDDWKTRYLFPALGMVPIRRDAARASMAALETAAQLLADGLAIGIYPEGTRSRDGLLHRGQSGVAHLALASGAMVVPVGLIGTDAVQPIGRSVPRLRGHVAVRFAPPLRADDYRAGTSRRRRSHLTADIMAAIASMTDQPVSPSFASDDPPLFRGGSEAVYRVVRREATGASWKHAAQAAVAEACGRYDDARVGEVRRLRCAVSPDGEVRFSTDLAISVRFRGGVQMGTAERAAAMREDHMPMGAASSEGDR